jgi:hypothetical protein
MKEAMQEERAIYPPPPLCLERRRRRRRGRTFKFFRNQTLLECYFQEDLKSPIY